MAEFSESGNQRNVLVEGGNGAMPLDAAMLARQAAALDSAQGNNRFVAAFGRAALYTAVQSPVESIAQLLDKAGTHNLAQRWHFMDAPISAPIGSQGWFGTQLGTVAGTAPWVLALHKGFSSAVGAGTGSSWLRETAAWAGTGAVWGGLLTPTDPLHGSGWSDRLNNAAADAATFGTLVASSRGLQALGVRNRVLSGILSGAPAGFVQRESQSLLAGRGLVFDNALAADVATYSALGGVFGLMPARLGTLQRTGSPLAEGRPAVPPPEFSAPEPARPRAGSAEPAPAADALPPIEPYEVRNGWRRFYQLPWVEAIVERYPQIKTIADEASVYRQNDFLTQVNDVWNAATPAERPYIKEHFNGSLASRN